MHWRRTAKRLLSRATRAGKAALLVTLALWLGFFPVFQAVHLAFANHDHRFCGRHLQIEDVPRAGPSTSRAGSPTEGGPPRVARAASVSSPADLLLSFHLQSSIARRSQPSLIPHDGSFQVFVPGSSDVIASCPHILLAPKTSPPPVTAC